MNVPTGVNVVTATPVTTLTTSAAGAVPPATSAQIANYYAGNLAAVGWSAYELAKAAGKRDRFSQALATANLTLDVAALAFPIIAPFAGLQRIANIQMALAHGYFAKQKAKKEERRALRNIGAFMAKAVEGGHNPAIAARMAVASRGIDPETVVPLGSPFANYNPRTGASDTPYGLLLDFGEGPAADAAREAHARSIEADLVRRPYPAFGVIPPPFVRLRKG